MLAPLMVSERQRSPALDSIHTGLAILIMSTHPYFTPTTSRERRCARYAVPSAALVLLSATSAAQTPFLTVRSDAEVLNGMFGLSVSGAGDVDGDGLSDLVVGAPGETVGTLDDAGHAFVFSGLDGTQLHRLQSPDPQPSARFGNSVAMLGDVDGDGRADVLIGAPSEDVGVLFAAGRAYVFNGFTGALVHTLVSPNVEDGGSFGEAVAVVDDADGDGVDDLLVGAFAESPGLSPDQAGRAYLFSGATGAFVRAFASPNEQQGGNFGWSVAGAGDLTGDGFGDVLVGAIGENTSRGRVYGFDGLTGARIGRLSSPNPEPGGEFGVSVAGVADIDGDGVRDVLVGAEGEDVAGFSEAGRAYLFSGADGLLLHTLLSPTPGDLGSLGASVAPAGDQNGDGVPDVIVGAYSEEGAGMEEAGQAHIFSGATGTILSSLTSPTPTRFGFFGVDVAFAGDVNADGAPDVLVGASRDTPLGSPVGAGRAHVVVGSGGTSTVIVDIEPVNPPIVIGPAGGTFEFTVTFRNTTSAPQTIEARTAVQGPAERDPVIGPVILTLGPNQILTRTLSQPVPASAPAGIYTYRAIVRVIGSPVVSIDAFAFVKSATN